VVRGGGGFQIAIDRYGRVYASDGLVAAGGPGFGASMNLGWLVKSGSGWRLDHQPSAGELNDLLGGGGLSGASARAGISVGGSVTQNTAGALFVSLELCVGSPGFGAAVSHMVQVAALPAGWGEWPF
jgi:hypothetical protein